MKKIGLIVLYIVLAAGIIGAALWYNSKSNESIQQAEVQQGVAAVQAQSQLMQELKIQDLIVGTGTVAEAGDTLTVLYTGTLDNGVIFDASSLHGNQPFSFVLGAGQVIQGWDLGLVGMRVGGKRQIVIPPNLGYGAQANGSIPANSTLHFTVQLLSVNGSSSVAGQ